MILLSLALAHADGGSADIELVPAVAVEVVPGLSEAPDAPAGSLAASFGGQWTQNPLVTSSFGTEQALVGQRLTGWLGARFHFTRKIAVDVAIPVARQWGGEVASADADGGGFADPRLSFVGTFASGKAGAAWLSVGVGLPLGAKDMWLGERGVRGGASLGGSSKGKLSVHGGVGVEARDAASADALLALGTEGWFRGGLSLAVGPVDLGPHVVMRTGSRGVLVSSPTLGVEPGFGVAVRPSESLRFAVVGGIGVTDGYGVPDGRVRATVTWRRDAKPRVVEPPEREQFDLELSDRPPPVPVFEPEPPPPRAPTPALPVIAEVVHFPLDDFGIDAAGIAAIDAVAVRLMLDPTLDHVVIVGHASDEGGYRYNYDLAERRARAVFEALVAKGIHPHRLSWRAMGEVEHQGLALPADRRVTFQAVAIAIPAPTRAPVPQPWDGAETRPRTP